MTAMVSKTAIGVAALVLGASISTANATVIHTDGATDFNGVYRGVGTFSTSFISTATSGSISFDLFGANSVDGLDTGGFFYDDLFTITLNGADVFAGYFNMSGGGSNSVITNTLGWTWNTVTNPGGNFSGGVTSITGILSGLNVGSNTFEVTFSSPGGAGDQGTGDESWALNDLDILVAPVPLPAGGLFLLGALGGLAALRRRKIA
jgi:hypothetical protein